MKKFFAGDKKVRVIAVLGIAGILLILLSEFLPGGKSQESDGNTAVFVETDTAVKAQQLEQKLRSIVECIEGVGQADVMVTLQNGVEYIYAQEEKTNTDTVEDATAQTGSKVQQKNSSEQSYILIESSGEKLSGADLPSWSPGFKGLWWSVTEEATLRWWNRLSMRLP